MSVQLRDFLLGAALAAATPALGQTVAPPVPPVAGIAQDSASMPNFSGRWAHPYLTGFEPPRSGPGPVRNKSRLPNGVANFQLLVGDYSNPILKPHAAEIVKKHGEISLKGEGYPTPSNQCWPPGVPYIFWDFWMEMIQKPDKIVMIYRHGNEVRWVRVNESHPAHPTPSWHGDAVAHYEGDTLVVDTVGMRVDRPYAMIDLFGTPYTKALHVVERYRLLDHDAAKDEIARAAKENWRPAGPINPDYKDKYLQVHLT